MNKTFFRNIILFLLAFLEIFSLSGCKNHNENNSYNINLFNRYLQKPIIYNTEKKALYSQDNTENYFMYEFPTQSNIFSVGHSIENNFEIISYSSDEVKVLLSFGSCEAVFPLATDGKFFYFIHSFYREDGTEIENNRCISLYDIENNCLYDIKNICGLITNGTILDGQLYFTKYLPERKNFELYKTKCSYSSNCTVELVSSGLESGKIYSDGEKLWKTSNGKITCANLSVNARYLNYFSNKKLIQLDINHQGAIAIYLIEPKTGELLYQIDSVLDFKIESNILTIYGEGFIEKVNL